MEKEIKIEAPAGYEIDKDKSTFEKIVFKKKSELPKSWRELGTISGCYIDGDGNIECGDYDYATTNNNKDVFPTQAEAEASIALAQLCQLRDRYNGGRKVDWIDNCIFKYVIDYYAGKISTGVYRDSQCVLSFKSENLRDQFLENFKDLIEKAKPLL